MGVVVGLFWLVFACSCLFVFVLCGFAGASFVGVAPFVDALPWLLLVIMVAGGFHLVVSILWVGFDWMILFPFCCSIVINGSLALRFYFKYCIFSGAYGSLWTCISPFLKTHRLLYEFPPLKKKRTKHST